MKAKKRLLFIGDAGTSTGFAKSAHAYLHGLAPEFDITVLALGYIGDPHGLPFRIYAAGAGGDGFGLGRMKEMIQRTKPQVIVVQNDPWNFPHYIKRAEGIPVVGIVAVDALNCNGTAMNGLHGAIFWTTFGEAEARKGGYTRPSAVVPLGVDLETYKPLPDSAATRRSFGLAKFLSDNGLPENPFIVGYVGRNQQRKRLDLLVEYFAEWIGSYERRDACLWIQRAPTGEQAYDIAQLARYYGIADRVILPSVSTDNQGIQEHLLARVYSVFDIMATTTLGEGWGLPQMEGMACGIPQVAPKFSALGEWADGVAQLVPCTAYAATPNGPNTIGGIADQRLFCAALDRLYCNGELRAQVREAGLQLVARDDYRWPQVGARVLAHVQEMMAVAAPPQVQQPQQPQAVTA